MKKDSNNNDEEFYFDDEDPRYELLPHGLLEKSSGKFYYFTDKDNEEYLKKF